jgi:hypothetical protein
LGNWSLDIPTAGRPPPNLKLTIFGSENLKIVPSPTLINLD